MKWQIRNYALAYIQRLNEEQFCSTRKEDQSQALDYQVK